MSDDLRILFIIDDLERGGPELRLLDFARYFPKHFKIFVCVTSEHLALLKEFKACGVEVMVIPIHKAYLSFRKIWKISRYMKQKDIRILNAFDFKSLIIAVYIKNLLIRSNIKVIYHNVNSLIEVSSFKLPILSLFLKYCDISICNSKASMIQIRSLITKERIKVIYNGVDKEIFRRDLQKRHFTRQNLNLKEDEIVLGIVANFRKQKNYPFLMLAFEKLSFKYQGLRLLCVGGGMYLEDAKVWVSSKNLESRVIFTGYSENVADYLNIVDILVLPSLWEGLPNALLQAMSVGVPVIASNVGGCPEIICHLYNGILFPSNDLERFVEAVEKLIEDLALRSKFSANARKTVDDKFSMERMVEEYETLYNSFQIV